MDAYQGINIDPEEWLRFIFIKTSDRRTKQELINTLSQKVGLTPTQVEEVLHALTEKLVRLAHSN